MVTEMGIIEVAAAEEGKEEMLDTSSLAWFSEKHCLLIAMSEGSFSEPLISDLLLVAVIAAVVVTVAAVAVDVVVVVVVVAVVVIVLLFGGGVGDCAEIIILFGWFGLISLSSPPSSLASC